MASDPDRPAPAAATGGGGRIRVLEHPSGGVASTRAKWRAMPWERINRRAVAACDILRTIFKIRNPNLSEDLR